MLTAEHSVCLQPMRLPVSCIIHRIYWLPTLQHHDLGLLPLYADFIMPVSSIANSYTSWMMQQQINCFLTTGTDHPNWFYDDRSTTHHNDFHWPLAS